MRNGGRKKAVAVCFVVILVFSYIIPVFATESNKVLRVPFVELKGFYEYSASGRETGYGVEYLSEIRKYTGYQFEFVKVKDWEQCGPMLQQGKIDLVMPVTPPAVKNPDSPYIMSKENIIYTYTAILAMDTEKDLYYNDFEKLNNRKIALTRDYFKNMDVREYLNEMQFTPQLVEYDTTNQCKEALKSGEVDAVITNILDYEDGMKILAHFGNMEGCIYMMKGREEEIKLLSGAICSIRTDNPRFEVDLYEKYYPERFRIPFTKEEMEYIRETKSLTVGVDTSCAPITYFDEETKEFKGIGVEILKALGKKIGIEFKFNATMPYREPVNSFGNVEIDLVMPTVSGEYYNERRPVQITDNILDAKIALATLKDTEIKQRENLIIGIPQGIAGGKRILEKEHPKAVVVEYKNDEACLKALKRGEINAIGQNAFVLSHLLRDPHYENVRLVSSLYIELPYCIAARGNSDPRLIAVLNKGIRELDENEVWEIINRHTIYEDTNLSFKNYLYKNRRLYLMFLFVLCILVLSGYFYTRQRQNFYQQVEEKNKALEKANNAKSEFLSRMSHEMRTPMNAIIGMSGLALEQENVPLPLVAYLSKINTSSQFLLSLINDILDMSKIESEKMKLNIQPVRVAEIFGSVISIIKPQMEEKNINFIFHIDGDGTRYAMLDKMRLQQIFLNLLSNAVKFTYAGGTVECLVSHVKMEGNRTTENFIIRDSGIGMSKEFMERMFLPFEQENLEIATNYGGTGLGLSIVKNLVELMGGTLSVTSEKGVGTEFVFQLTYEVANQSAKIKKDIETANKRFDFSGKRVLLVEDHLLNVEVAKKLLLKKGFAVDVAENGQVAVEMFHNAESRHYDVILMDIRMPVMDGISATRAIRQLEKGDAKTVPIIAMTANVFDQDLQECIVAGMDDHLEKPVNPKLLFETMDKFLSSHEVSL